MKKEERELLRLFYQSIPTNEEKMAYLQILGSSREKKLGYILAMAPNMNEATRQAILAATALTKEDRAIICGAVARGFILKLFSFMTGGGWK